MLNAIQQRVLVQDGGRIELTSPELPVGAEADVIVLLRSALPTRTLTPLEALDALQKSARLTPEAADEWIENARVERERWGHRG